MELWELIAREAIRDLVARYNACGDRGRFDEAVALFIDDGELETHTGAVHRGHAAIRGVFTGVQAEVRDWPVRPRIQHHTSGLVIDVVSPTEATSRCYWAVLMETGLDHWGHYVDRYACVGGRWLFARRSQRLDGCEPDGFAASRYQGDRGRQDG